MDLLDGLRVFVATVESGSFSAAGDRLGMSGKLASKYLAKLEDKLDTRLLHRTTRRISMTPAGEQLYARVPAWLDELEIITGELNDTSAGLRGTLRLSAPLTFGEMHLQGLIKDFRALHPGVTINLALSDAYTDLAASGIDVAIRIGRLTDSSLIARRLGYTRLLLVANQAYLDRCGHPQTIADLQHHNCIRDTNSRSTTGWVLSENNETSQVSVRGNLLVNSARMARDFSRSGEGIAQCPDYVVQSDIEQGKLVHVLSHCRGLLLDIHAVFLETRHMPKHVRAFLDFLTQHMRTMVMQKSGNPPIE